MSDWDDGSGRNDGSGWDGGPSWFAADDGDGCVLDLPAAARIELAWILARLGDLIVGGDVPELDLDAAGEEVWDVGATAVVRLRELASDQPGSDQQDERHVLDDAALAEWAMHANNLTVITRAAAIAVRGSVDATWADEGTSGGGDEFVRMSAFLERLTDESVRAGMRRVQRRRDGTFRLRWSADDRAVVASLARDLDQLIGTDDPAITRLFPPAYGTDAERSREYAALANEELIGSRRATLAVVLGAIDQQVLDEEQLSALLRAVNDIRLVIGTRLDVSEDEGPLSRLGGEDADLWLAYHRLGEMLYEIIQALRGSL